MAPRGLGILQLLSRHEDYVQKIDRPLSVHGESAVQITLDAVSCTWKEKKKRKNEKKENENKKKEKEKRESPKNT